MRVSFFKAALLMGALLMGFGAGAQQTPTYQWAQGVQGTTAGVVATSTAVSPSGDVYTGCHYSGALSVGGQTFPTPASGFTNCLLLRYSPTGTVVGSLLLGTQATISQVKTDAAGNVYALGRFFGTVQAGTTLLTATPTCADYFVGKWDAAGTLQWLQQGTGGRANQSEYDQLVVDAAGRVTIAGALVQFVTFGGVTFGPTGGGVPFPVLFALQLDGATGAFRWQHNTASTAAANAYATSLAVEPATGSLVLTGEALGEIEWDGHRIGDSFNHMYWLRLNANGDLLSSFGSKIVPGNGLFTSLYDEPHVAAAENGYSFLSITSVSTEDTVTLNGADIPLRAQVGGYTIIARLDPSGVPQWTRVLFHQPQPGDSSQLVVSALASMPLSVAARGGAGGLTDCYLGGSYRSWSAFPLGSGIRLPAAGGPGYVAALDGATGATVWATDAAAGAWNAYVNGLSVAASGQIALAGDTQGDSLRFGGIRIGYPSPLNSGFTAKLVQQYNQITGAAFIDANSNSLPDAGERPFSGLIVESQPDGTFFTTELNGAYSAVTELGTHTVSLPTAAAPLYHTLPAAPAPATFTTFGNIAGGRHFAFQPVPNQQDLQVFVTAVSRARPGFGVRYEITYRNIGTTTTSGTVAVALDARLSYLGNSGNATLSGNTLTANYTALAPGERRSFEIQFQVPTTVALGTVLATTATVEPVSTDQTPADNTESNQLTVTGSYDPNDIAVNWPRLTPTQVTAGEWLEYVIRFENLGTDTAFSVLLRDSLPLAQLNLASLQLTAASHNCTWRLAPGGLLTVTFTSIRLPYRNINAFRSTGFVRFRVRPRGTLTLGDVVPNRADIHFDYNAPVRTNTALTTVQLPTGLGADADAATSALSAWPNPTSGTLNVALEVPTPGPLHLTIFDQLGRRVLTHTAPDARQPATLDVRTLPAGLYVVRATTADGASVGSRRVVVR